MPRKKKPIRVFDIRVNLVLAVGGFLMLGIVIIRLTLAPSIDLLQPFIFSLVTICLGVTSWSIARRKRYARTDTPPSQRTCTIYLVLLLTGAVFLLTTPFWVYNGLSYIFAIIPLIFLALGLSGVLVLEIRRQRQVSRNA